MEFLRHRENTGLLDEISIEQEDEFPHGYITTLIPDVGQLRSWIKDQFPGSTSMYEQGILAIC